MTYAWPKASDLTGKNPSASAENVDPYEDWEKMTRPPALGEVPLDARLAVWQPVYVELTAGTAHGDFVTLAAAHENQIRLTEDSLIYLNNGPAPPLRFFVFRPDTVAYDTELADGTPLPYRILQVGPAIPLAFASQLILPQSRKLPLDAREKTVLTAVIDDQIGFANERFRDARNKSRIERLWLQAMPEFARSSGAGGMTVGNELGPKEIDDALDHVYEDDIYRSAYREGVPSIPIPQWAPRTYLDLLDPTHIRPFGFQAGHGTHVLDLAAGFPPDDDRTDRPIVAVQVPTLATAETWGARLDLFILMAVIRILHWADTISDAKTALPVVINISYGVLAGPKDGSGFLESEIARLVNLRNRGGVPTFVVWASGNGFRARTHARMVLGTNDSDAVTLRVQPEDLSVTFTEIWLDNVEKVDLTLTPDCGPPKTITVTNSASICDWTDDGHIIGRVYVQLIGGRMRVVLALCPSLNHEDPARTAPAGAYGIKVENLGTAPVIVSIDVQRDDTPSGFPRYGRQAYLDHEAVDSEDSETFDRNMPGAGPVSREGTLSANATALTDGVVVVGGAFDRDALATAALYSSSGATLARGGPDLSAVSEETRSHPGRIAAGLFSGSVSLFSGTSVAAPQVTRALVDWIAAGGGAGGAIDLPVILAGGVSLPGQDARLGHGTLAFAAGRGRVARRERD